jgi:cytochrome P450
VPPQEKTLDRLEDESALLLGAGTETTARAIAVSMFHLIYNKDVGLKLREELKTVLKTPQSKASWTDLEKLPYQVSVTLNFRGFSEGTEMLTFSFRQALSTKVSA